MNMPWKTPRTTITPAAIPPEKGTANIPQVKDPLAAMKADAILCNKRLKTAKNTGTSMPPPQKHKGKRYKSQARKDRRAQILEVVCDIEMTRAEIAASIGYSVNQITHALKYLVDTGQVKEGKKIYIRDQRRSFRGYVKGGEHAEME